jgi:hypothetical protein
MALVMNPQTGLLEEDGMSPESTPTPSINPQVLDMLSKKYNLGAYSDANRQELVKNQQVGLGDKFGAALASIGAGFMGKDATSAGMSKLQAAKQDKANELAQFDKSRSNLIQEQELGRELTKQEREDKSYSESEDLKKREMDPNSEESKIANQAAQRMGYKGPPITAQQFKSFSPAMEKIYQIEQQKLNRQDTLRAQAAAREDAKSTKQTIKEEKEAVGTKDQNTARGFGKRVEAAEQAFKDIESTGYNRSDVSSGIGSMLPNILRTDEGVRQDQAERNFINAVLRRESGAAISPGEFSSAEQQYFPRAGDGPDTLKQKEENRKLILESLKREAGKTWGEEEGVKPSKKEVKRQKSPSTGKIKVTYDDGSEEII